MPSRNWMHDDAIMLTRDDLPALRPLPVATMILTGACLLAFGWQGLAGAGWWEADSAVLLRLGAGHGPAIDAGEHWRLLAAVFLHGGLLHLVINLLALLEIGGMTERRLGAWRCVLVFLVAGAGGVMASAAWDRQVISVGASGGIYGLFAVWLALRWRQAEPMPTVDRRPRQALIALVAVLALGVGFLVPGVDNVAHLAGFFVGLVLGTAFPAGRVGGRAFWRAGALLAVLVLLSALLFPPAWGEGYADRRRFAERYHEFARADRRATEVLQRLGQESRAGSLGDSAAVSVLDAEVLPVLRRLVAHWQNERFAAPDAEADRRLWLRYASLRLAAIIELRTATLTGDPHAAKRFEQALREAAALVESAGRS